jgi:serine/threonine-protein kinase
MTAWNIPSYAEWAVPGYMEERLLGHGVAGRVVAAVSEATGRRVAIKYLDANLVRDTEFLGQYRSVAERLMSLDAPHLVRLFDFAEQPGEGAAIVMELVDGVSLREMMVRRGPLGAAAALVVLKDSLLGLVAAHSRRIAHRDVKPDNVLIDAGGWCKLTDCGLAVKADKQQPVAGTPAYLAPELWHGAPNVPATDIYAAAAVLCESVTGKPPFSGRLAQLRQQHESAPLPLDQLGQPLQDLIAWGMAKNPADRPPSARAFVLELDARAAAAYGPNWEDQGRRELAERATALLPLVAAAGGGSAAATRRAKRKILAFVSVGAVVVVALGAAGAVALSRQSDNVRLSSSSTAPFAAQVTVTPPVAASTCTTGTTFTYSGTVTATEPGTVSYQWLYSSGKQGPVQTVSFTAPGHRQVSGGTVKSRAAGSGWAEIKVTSPVASTSDKAAYKLSCKAAAAATASASAQATSSASSRSSASPSASPSKTTTSPKATATSPTPAPTTTSPTPTPTPTTTSPTPTPTTTSPTPTPTTTSPTPTPTTTSPTPTTSTSSAAEGS